MMTMLMKIQTNKPELIAPAEIRGKASPLFNVVKSPELGKKEITHKSDKFCAQRCNVGSIDTQPFGIQHNLEASRQ